METDFLIVALTDCELKDLNGGMARLDPLTIYDPLGLIKGFIDAWVHSTQF